VGLVASGFVLAAYVLVSGGPQRQRWLPAGWRAWLDAAVSEEQIELEGAIDHTRARTADALVAVGAVLVVIGASVAMEQTATTLGTRLGVAEIVIGGLVLAAVTSLPNAVSAIYLAARGRGAATLSTALNSNALNVAAGLLVPATILGLGPASGQTTLITGWYAGFTLAVLALAFAGRGLRRAPGLVIVAGYAAFVVAVVLST
jgi:Ca2+/Na+ antiporter